MPSSQICLCQTQKRYRDWLSAPKPNGYEAVHSTVMGPDGRWVEVQIRTQRMDEIAERGYAAHWKYKNEGDGLKNDSSDGFLIVGWRILKKF